MSSMKSENWLIYFLLILSSVYFVASNETYTSAFEVEDMGENYSLTKCVLKILKHEFQCKSFITFAYFKSDVNELMEALNNNKCYTFNIRSFDSRNWDIWNEVYIIITEDFAELTEALNQLENEMFWNPRAHFLLYTQNINDGEIPTLFEQFLKHKMYKIVFLHQKNKEIYVQTYRPFSEGNCGNHIEDIQNLGSCLEIKTPGYYPINIKAGLKNCKFKAVKYAPTSSGLHGNNKKPILEQFVVDTFAHSLNYSVQYEVVKTEINYGVVLPNRTVTGLLGQLHGNVADIALGSTVIIKNRADIFDFICGIKIASFKIFTSALGKEMWKKVYTEFDPGTWLLILSFYLLMVVVCIILLNMSPKIHYSYSYLIVKLWGFFYLGNGTEPYAKSGRLRSVTAFWIWFTFFISSFYNSDMYSLITGHVQRKRQIDPEMINSISYRPCISTVINTFFFFAYNQKLPKSLDIADCRSIDGAFKTVANSHDLYTVQLKESYLEREKFFIDSEGNRKLEAWDFSSDTVLGFYLTKGFAAKEELQMHAQRMYETGLVEHYLNVLNPSRGSIDRRKKNKTQPFILGDFRVHFGVLFIGTVFSTFAFVFEILYYRKHK